MTPHQQYEYNLILIEHYQKILDELKRQTKAYHYVLESERVKDKKKDSEQYYKQLKTQQ